MIALWDEAVDKRVPESDVSEPSSQDVLDAYEQTDRTARCCDMMEINA